MESAHTEAARWQFVGATNTFMVFVDIESISGEINEPKEAWFKSVYQSPDCTSDSEKYLNQCIRRRYV